MGHDSWYEFCIGKEGESTAGMCAAEAMWGQALYHTNSPTLAKLPTVRRDNLTILRKNMPLFREKCIDVAFVISGGGTMWNPVYSASWGSSEEVLRYILLRKGTKPKAASQAEVWKALSAGRAGLVGIKSTIGDRLDTTGQMYDDATASMAEASRLWNEALKLIPSLSDSERGYVMGFYKQAADIMDVESLDGA